MENTMNATIQKWGNSLALRLPKVLADKVHIAEGAQVELVPTAEGLLLKPERKRHYRLSELVAGITPENLHPETDWGPSVGREIVK
jgi:antitoxin MazE